MQGVHETHLRLCTRRLGVLIQKCLDSGTRIIVAEAQRAQTSGRQNLRSEDTYHS